MSPLEWLWLIVTVTFAILSVFALQDAVKDKAAIKRANGRAREVVGNGNVRREAIRIWMGVCLLLVLTPRLLGFPRDVAIVSLVLVPVLLTANSLLDTAERRRLAAILETDIAAERRQKLRDAG